MNEEINQVEDDVELRKMRKLLSAVCLLESNIRGARIENVSELFGDLLNIGAMYLDMKPGAQRAARYYVHHTSLLYFDNRRDDVELYWDLEASLDTVIGYRDILVFPSTGGAVYRTDFRNGKAEKNHCVSRHDGFDDVLFAAGTHAIQTQTPELDKSYLKEENLFFEINLKPNSEIVGRMERTQLFQLLNAGMELRVNDKKVVEEIALHKVGWMNWLMFVIEGHDPSVKLKREQWAEGIAFLGRNTIEVQPMFKMIIRNFAVFDRDQVRQVHGHALLRPVKTEDYDVYDVSGSQLKIDNRWLDGMRVPKTLDEIRSEIKAHFTTLEEPDLVGAHVVWVSPTLGGLLEKKTRTDFYYSESQE